MPFNEGEARARKVFTDEERARNLRAACRVRHERSLLLARIRSGEVGVTEALADPVAQRMRVTTFLRAIPGVGPKRAELVMRTVGIAPNRRVFGLGARQLRELSKVFESGLPVERAVGGEGDAD